MSNIITFYDIASNLPGQAWSPSTYKTRYSLNFKGIPYKTVWVEYPDIEAACKMNGISSTSKKEDGSPQYTLPAIYDPSTEAALSESTLIAEYLDNAYPDTPKLFPSGTRALQHAFIESLPRVALGSLQEFIIPAAIYILNPPSLEYYRPSREKSFGKKLEDVVPTGKDREEKWAKIREGFGVVDGWLQKGKKDGPYLTGNTPCFADFVMASYLIWLRKVWGENSPEWKDIESWNDGRWAGLLKGLEQYETID